MVKKGKAFIGTSGFHYKHWVGTYYPKKTKPEDFLKFYIHDFKTLELNNPFYHLPPEETFLHWRKESSKNFTFSVKASRYITHIKKLHDCEEAVYTLLDHATGLKEKLGPILFQLPPGWKYNEERFQNFLKILPKKYRFAFEFRNHSWYNENSIELLKKYKVGFCIYELAGHLSPLEVTADFIYIRLHGPGDKYQGSYPLRTLKKWSEKIKNWTLEGKDVYCYFDNDQNGYAAFNSKKLSKLINN